MRIIMLHDSAFIASTAPSAANSSLALIPVLIFESSDTLKRMIIPPYFSFGL